MYFGVRENPGCYDNLDYDNDNDNDLTHYLTISSLCLRERYRSLSVPGP
jgi:hypothetical protein